ncbi:MAG: glycosyltransferase, partial [Actinomycetales bacterium]|nr:glycosyltransferase [Actinomycetales bacterium]
MSLDPTAPPASGAVDPARSTGPSRSRELSVSVVIPVRDDAEELEKCLALLARQSVRPFEVVVVDNGSTDASAEVARRWGAVVVVEPRPGIPAAAATGYDAARGQIIARLDADSRPDERWIATAVELLSERADLDALTGTGLFHDLPRGLRTVASVGYLGSYYVLTHLAVGNVPLWGSCMAVRREVWLRVREDVERLDAEVHDDLDLAFKLGPGASSKLVPSWRVGVSARSLRGRAQRRRRLDRAWRTLRTNWADSPPWERWGH